MSGSVRKTVGQTGLYLIVFAPVTAQDLSLVGWYHNFDSWGFHIPNS